MCARACVRHVAWTSFLTLHNTFTSHQHLTHKIQIYENVKPCSRSVLHAERNLVCCCTLMYFNEIHPLQIPRGLTQMCSCCLIVILYSTVDTALKHGVQSYGKIILIYRATSDFWRATASDQSLPTKYAVWNTAYLEARSIINYLPQTTSYNVQHNTTRRTIVVLFQYQSWYQFRVRCDFKILMNLPQLFKG
jgi:hypothetical protein